MTDACVHQHVHVVYFWILKSLADDIEIEASACGLASFPGSPSRATIPCMTFDPPEGKAEGEPGRFCHMTSVMLRHPYIRYRRGRTASMSLYLCIVRIGYARKQKTFALTAVHPVYACEATTSKEPARSQVPELRRSMEEQAGPTPSIPNVWVM